MRTVVELCSKFDEEGRRGWSERVEWESQNVCLRIEERGNGRNRVMKEMMMDGRRGGDDGW